MLNVLPLIEEPEWFKDITQENIDENILDIFKGDEIINDIIEKTNISLDPKNYIGRCEEQIFKFYT